MKLSSYKNLMYLECPDVMTKAIEVGELELEEMLRLSDEANAAMAELETEWPPERVKEQLLKEQRRRCEWAKKKITALELENRDARQKGVSYSKRRECSRHIEILKKIFADDRDKGIRFSRGTFTVKDFAKQGDLEFIHSRGFDIFLKYATL